VKLKVQATVSETTYEDERTIKAVLPNVTKISFVNNDHTLTDYDTKNTITDPVWMKPLGQPVSKNDEAAYTKSGSATAELEIEASDPLTNSTSVQVQGVKVAADDENFYPQGAWFQDWTWSPGELQLTSSPLYGSVNYYDTLDVKWQYRVEKIADGWGDWVEMNQSSHKLYTVNSTPLESPLYDFALEKACGYVNGSSDIAGKINTGMDNDINYDPGAAHEHTLDLFSAGEGECCCHAIVFRKLVRSVGVSGSVFYIWGGCSSNTVCYYRYGAWWGPSFRGCFKRFDKIVLLILK